MAMPLAEAEFSRAVRLTSAFYDWERRGRGWDVWPYPVDLEPPFRPFHFKPITSAPIVDDARKPTLFGGWFEKLGSRRPAAILPYPNEDESDEPEPPPSSKHPIVEFLIALPPDVKVSPELTEHFLLSLSTCAAPVSFEVVGTSESIAVQIACASRDASHVEEQLRAYFPDTGFGVGLSLPERWMGGGGGSLVVDFGLAHEFMQPLRTFARFDTDPLIGIVGALSDLAHGEVGIFQVLFQSTRAPWAEHIARAVTDWQGDSFFADAPELTALSTNKIERPLVAAVIRTAVRSPSPERNWQIARRVGGVLSQLTQPTSNELIALANDDYPQDIHVWDVLRRQSHRSGMLLNSAELVALVHPPSSSVRATRLTRDHHRTKAVPKALLDHDLCLGENSHAGVTHRVSIGDDQRLRHTHLVGASGTGKSTLLLNMLVQDMERGHGCALIDPHGDLVNQVLAHVPESRMKDVILVDPADTEFPVGFNILSAHSELEKTLLASDLVAVFRRLSTSWGDQMTSVLANAVLAFLESGRGGTLADLRRFLIEAEYRKEFLGTVGDSEVVYYWQKEFPLLSGRPQAPLLTRLDTFLRPKLVRNMVTQPTSLDFASIMNRGQILLVKLAQGAIGEENAALLGSLFVAKIHQLALGRQSIAEEDRRPFFVYLDEFQHFVTPSMATLLTGARKYRIGLVLAHQELRQLWNQDRDVAGAVLANATTRICFRVGDDDAKKLEDGFTAFTARDLQNLGVGQAICRVDRADWDFNLTTLPMPALRTDWKEYQARVVAASREQHAVRMPLAPKAPPPVLEQVADLFAQAMRQSAAPVAPKSLPPPFEPPVLPPRPGRGGAQHKYLQELIRRWGESHDWHVTVEKSILDGLGSVDVALEREGCSIACEVCVTSTTEYEIGNIQKCLTAGFDHVVTVVTATRALQRLRKAVREQFTGESETQVCVLPPDELFAFLEGLGTSRSSAEQTTRGYRIRVNYGRTGSRDSSSIQSIARTVVGALRRLGR